MEPENGERRITEESLWKKHTLALGRKSGQDHTVPSAHNHYGVINGRTQKKERGKKNRGKENGGGGQTTKSPLPKGAAPNTPKKACGKIRSAAISRPEKRVKTSAVTKGHNTADRHERTPCCSAPDSGGNNSRSRIGQRGGRGKKTTFSPASPPVGDRSHRSNPTLKKGRCVDQRQPKGEKRSKPKWNSWMTQTQGKES